MTMTVSAVRMGAVAMAMRMHCDALLVKHEEALACAVRETFQTQLIFLTGSMPPQPVKRQAGSLCRPAALQKTDCNQRCSR